MYTGVKVSASSSSNITSNQTTDERSSDKLDKEASGRTVHPHNTLRGLPSTTQTQVTRSWPPCGVSPSLITFLARQFGCIQLLEAILSTLQRGITIDDRKVTGYSASVSYLPSASLTLAIAIYSQLSLGLYYVDERERDLRLLHWNLELLEIFWYVLETQFQSQFD